MKIQQLVTAIEAFESQLADALRALPNAELVAMARRGGALDNGVYILPPSDRPTAQVNQLDAFAGQPASVAHRDAKPANVIPVAPTPPQEHRAKGRPADPGSVSQRVLAHVLSRGPVAPREVRDAVGAPLSSYLARHLAAGRVIQLADGRYAAPGTPEPP